MSQTVGKVLALFHAIKDKEGRFETETMRIDAQGILGDKYYGKNPSRTILITSEAASYALAASEGIDVPYGALGENILIDINPYNLKAGQMIRIGETILAVTQNCTLCNSLAKVNEHLPELLKDDRGIFVRTVQEGTIKKGDSVAILG